MTNENEKLQTDITQDDAQYKSDFWIYSDIVKDHFFHPRNILLNDLDYKFDGKGESGSAICGDMMIVWLKVNSETSKIIECKWRTFGCASAIASTSMMSVMVTENEGMTIDKALNLKPQQILERLGGLPDIKFHCSVMGHLALKEAIADYMQKNENRK